MDINLEKYTEDLLKGYCEKKSTNKNKFTKNINIIKKYSTNVLESHAVNSIKECKIRDSDPLINVTDPIAKTREDYENILGNIIEAECKLIDNDSSDKLSPTVLKLINFSNVRILEFNKNPIKSVENCNFKIRVYNKKGAVLFNESALYSLFLTLYNFLRTMIPIRISRNIVELRTIYDTIIHVVSESDPGYTESKLNEYTFQTNEGNNICLTNNSAKIINISKFILDLYAEFCVDEPDKPYLEDLKMYIDTTLQNNKYNAMEPLPSNNYYYLSNSGDGDCLFIAVVKYLCILTNTERQYPNNNTLRSMAKDLRFETCKYMFHNRYRVINDIGTIENNTEAMIWLLNSKRGETNNDKFNSLMNSLTIKRNISIFKNPTHHTLEELINLFKRDEIDDFTKYCILMSQYSMGSEHFLLEDSTKLYLSCYAGISEIVCIGLFLNKNIICSSTTLQEGSVDFGYNISTKFSHLNKSAPSESTEIPILIYLRGYKTKKSGSKSDHFEMLWPKSLGKPTGINAPRELSKSQKPLFGFNTTHTEKFVPNYDSTAELSVKLEVYNLDTFISDNIPKSYTEPLTSLILKHWTDMSQKISLNSDTLEHPNFGDLDKEVFVGEDHIRINNFLYTVEYLTKFTNVIEKGFATKSELEEIIALITKSEKIDITKPIEIKLSEPDDEGNIEPIYTNFRDKQTLLNLLKNADISKNIKKKKENPIVEDEPSGIMEESVPHSTINLDTDNWVIFGNYYYKKTYIQLPLKQTNPSNKSIIKALKKLHLHRQTKPIRVIENFSSGSFDEEYIYSIYTDDDDDDLENDLLHNLLKKIPVDKIQILVAPSDDKSAVPEIKNINLTTDKEIIHKIKSVAPTLVDNQTNMTELKEACKKKTRKDGGLYKVAFRNSLIEYIKTLYSNDPEKVLKEIKRLKKIKHRNDLEKYCVEIKIL